MYFLNPELINEKHNDVILHHEYIASSLDKKDRETLLKWKKNIILNISHINKEEVINEIFKDDIDLYFIGHKHTPFIIEKNNKQIIDIGSSGCTDSDVTYYVILTVNKDIIEINKKYLKYDKESFKNKIMKNNYTARDYFAKHNFNI